MLLALVPVTALARKPAFYRPREVVDSEALATAATARLTAGIRARNVAKIGEVLGTSFTNNGMWFPDAACAKRFASGGEVKGAEVGVFARCLSQLTLQMTTRKAASRDGALVTVDPGIEIELAFKGDALRWIGFPLQAGVDRAIPMLTAQALEALRTAGTAVVDRQVAVELELELAKQRAQVASSWIKVCLDPRGEIVRLTTLNSTSTAASDAFTRAVADWKFQPFKVRGTAQPACGVALLTYPGTKAPAIEVYPSSQAPAAPITRSYDFDDDDFDFVGVTGGVPIPPPPPPPMPPQTVPPSLLEAQRLSGTRAIVPDPKTKAEIVASGKSKIITAVKVCLDDKGSVSSTAQLKSSGFAAYDRKLITEIRNWTFKPYKVNGRAVPVCTPVTFVYDASKP